MGTNFRILAETEKCPRCEGDLFYCGVTHNDDHKSEHGIRFHCWGDKTHTYTVEDLFFYREQKDKVMQSTDKFPIVTICGSMRFYGAMLEAAQRLSKEGLIVLMPHVTFIGQEQSSETKIMLDKMHFAKIDMSDSICVVTNTDGYTGQSTQREMAYALQHNKELRVIEYRYVVTTESWEFVGALASGM